MLDAHLPPSRQLWIRGGRGIPPDFCQDMEIYNPSTGVSFNLLLPKILAPVLAVLPAQPAIDRLVRGRQARMKTLSDSPRRAIVLHSPSDNTDWSQVGSDGKLERQTFSDASVEVRKSEMEVLTCVKCGGGMQEGFVPDKTVAGSAAIANWYAGPAVGGQFGDLNRLHLQPAIPVATFRCSDCGFLEFYADRKFPPKRPADVQ